MRAGSKNMIDKYPFYSTKILIFSFTGAGLATWKIHLQVPFDSNDFTTLAILHDLRFSLETYPIIYDYFCQNQMYNFCFRTTQNYLVMARI